MPDDFFVDLKDWSERKLKLIEQYLGAASHILKSKGQVFYVDGFAGQGTYGEKGEIKGSPLRAAELAHQIAVDKKPFTLTCINVESNSEYFSNLDATTRKFGNLVRNIHGTFVDSADQILGQIDRKPAVLFLDPFGVKGIDWSTMVKFIKRPAPTDLWIRFDTFRVRRLAGWFKSGARGAERQFENLLELYGIDDRDYLYSRLDGPTSKDRIQNAITLYEERLSTAFSNARGEGFAAEYRIGSLTELTKFFLVFATGGRTGVMLANDIVCRVEENYQRDLELFRAQKNLQSSLFPLDPTEDEVRSDKIQRLKEDIWTACKGSTLTRMAIFIRIGESWFGEIRGTHLNAALKELLADGRIVNATGAVSHKETRFKFRKPA